MNAEGFVSLMAPVGPVAEAFVADERVLTSIMGPIGSAKTTSCIRKIVQSAGLQDRSPRDGVRRVRWAVVRDTYGQLETNVLKSWWTWFPKDMGEWNGKDLTHRIKLDVARLAGEPPERWEIELLFRAMGDQKAEDVLKGLELTGLWLNEADTLHQSVLTFGIGRTGRYPSAVNGGCQYRAVIADFNAPDIDNYTYPLFVERKLPISDEQAAELRAVLGPRFGVGFHRQPGGRSTDPPPENIRNLPLGYYEMSVLGMSENMVRRLIDNEFGAVRNGQPVYPEFNDGFHCAQANLDPVPGVPVSVAFDGGSTPAAVFGQRLESGQVRVLSEVVVFADSDDVSLERMGPEDFGNAMGDHWLERYAKCAFGKAGFDPAALYGDEYMDSWARLAWKAFVKRVSQQIAGARTWKAKPAPVKGNRLPVRIEGVRRLLTTSPGGKPGLLVSPACSLLRRGFNNGYVFVRLQLSNGQGRWKDEPLKNDFSHVHDALQYLIAVLTKLGDEPDFDPVRGAAERKARRGKVDFGAGAFAHRARA